MKGLEDTDISAEATKRDLPDLNIHVISQFHNGGKIIEFQMPQATEHLKNKSNRDAFIQALDPMQA
jgi:hypothetical protein